MFIPSNQPAMSLYAEYLISLLKYVSIAAFAVYTILNTVEIRRTKKMLKKFLSKTIEETRENTKLVDEVLKSKIFDAEAEDQQ